MSRVLRDGGKSDIGTPVQELTDCNELRGGEHSHSKKAEPSRSAEVWKEGAGDSAAVCQTPWKAALLFNALGKMVEKRGVWGRDSGVQFQP